MRRFPQTINLLAKINELPKVQVGGIEAALGVLDPVMVWRVPVVGEVQTIDPPPDWMTALIFTDVPLRVMENPLLETLMEYPGVAGFPKMTGLEMVIEDPWKTLA